MRFFLQKGLFMKRKILQPLIFIIIISIMACSALRPVSNDGTRDRLTTMDPRAYYHFIRGYSAELDGDHETAYKAYQEALYFDQKSVSLLNQVATLMLKRGDSREAQSYIESALKVEPGHIPTLMLLGGLYTGQG